MNVNEINDVLEAHKLWVESYNVEGSRADLNGANLSGANFSDANLEIIAKRVPANPQYLPPEQGVDWYLSEGIPVREEGKEDE